MKKALLIGIDYVSSPIVLLNGCINDIITIRNMLIDAYDYDQSNITILRDDSGDFIQPTRTNIVTQLNNMIKDSVNLEEIWFHYSGHGSQLKDRNSEMRDIIIPSNYQDEGFIMDSELLDIISKIKCRSIFVFDCCHSGSVCDMPWTFEYTDGSQNNYSKSRTNTINIENPNIYVFSGCRDDQSSADSSNTLDQSVGAFSNAFVECLRANHHNISITDLYKNICVYLLQNGYSQTPILSSSNQNPDYIITKPQSITKYNNKPGIIRNIKLIFN
jgi:hypothetical protein